MKRISFLFILIILISSSIYSQSTVTGKVTAESDGLGLPGVNILVQGIVGSGTITDYDGNYSIEVPENATHLQYSFIGMRSEEVEISGRSIINLVMVEESELLEGVIVTAIGIKVEKKSIGYAAQEVSGEDISGARETNIVNALSSKVAGIEVTSSSGTPGASSNITIRGRTSLTQNNSPLFVVDGVPIDNDYSGSYYVDHSNRAVDLNSDDIESVTVLKGASAAALYGIRAANGAIIVTTKSGKGKGDHRKNITFSSSISFDQVNKLPEKQSKYAQGSSGVYSDNGNTSWGPLIDTMRYDGDNTYYLNPNGRIVGMNDPTATDQRVNVYNNSVDDFFQTAMKHNTHVSMSGGNETGNYYFSVGHLDQSGIIPNSEFKRTTFKISGESKLTEKLKVSGSATYSNSGGVKLQKGSNLSAVMVGLLRNTPTFDITNGLSDPANNESAYMFPDGTQRSFYRSYNAELDENYAVYSNPYWSINKNIATDNVNRLIGYSQIDYEITSWLRTMYRIGLDFYAEERETYLDNRSADIYPNGYISISNYDFRSVNSDVLLTADHKLADDIKVSAILGHNYYTKETYANSWTGDTFVLPGFYDISNTSTQSGDDTRSLYKIVGVFYDLKLAYKGFLYFNTTGRNDWSSTLPSGKNSFFYPSFNAGFIFTDAFNMDKNPILNYGKVRASYAEVGNDAAVYSLENYFSEISGGINGQVAFATLTTMGNLNLAPEKTKSSEFGVDLRFFQNKIGLDFAIYQSKSIGQIVSVPVAYSTGFRFLKQNAGIVTNNGIETQLFLTPIETKEFSWDIMVNFTKNKNIVDDLAEGIPLLEFETTGLSSTRSVAIEGEPYGVLYGSRYLRNENNDIIVGADGYPMVDSEAGIVGDPNPDFTVGFKNSFSFKGFQLSALFDFRKGGDVHNGTKGVMLSLGTHKETENRDEDYIFPGVRNDGTEEDPNYVPNDVAIKRDRNYYSRLGGLAGLSEMVIEDGSWVRLREVSLTYRMPLSWFENLPISSMNAGISGRNLFLITPYTGIDPETNLSGAARSLGRDYFNMPNTRSFEFNIQVKF
jgi:TonB-linked SusC/RagA family outer membrane protein